MVHQFKKEAIIHTDPATIWRVLTEPELIKQWMGEPEMKIEIHTDWKVGSPVIIRGFHHVKFENRGTVLQYEPEKILSYTHLSSVSRLPDTPENYSTLEFVLTPHEDHTLLHLTVMNFPTESIYKHLEFYWNATLGIIKNFAEQQTERYVDDGITLV